VCGGQPSPVTPTLKEALFAGCHTEGKARLAAGRSRRGWLGNLFKKPTSNRRKSFIEGIVTCKDGILSLSVSALQLVFEVISPCSFKCALLLFFRCSVLSGFCGNSRLKLSML